MSRQGSTGPASLIESTRRPLGPAVSTASASEAEARLQWRMLDFTMQPQDQSNWCWAAVAASVARFFKRSSTVTQCAVANGQLRRDDCCAGGASGPCNVYGLLASSLHRVGHLQRWAVGKRATLAELTAEIDQARPLCLRVAWFMGGAHFLAVSGYLAGSELVAVEDPWWGQSDVPYDILRTSYQDAGRWTDSYYTEA